MEITLERAQLLVVMDCPTCYVLFALPKRMAADHRRDGGSFYCPSGHSMSYTKTELERVRAELEKAQRAAIDAREERDNAERTAAIARTTAKRETTRRKNLQKRATAGVCLLCHRSFEQLRRHMASKHAAAPEISLDREISPAAAAGGDIAVDGSRERDIKLEHAH